MADVLIAIVVVIALLGVLVLIFASTTKRVNVLIKNLFVDKLQEYDYLIDDKEKKIDELNTTIDKKKKSYIKLEQELDELKKNKGTKEEIVVETEVALPSSADFEDGNILTGYKKIKENFDFDAENIIKEFVMKEVKDNENYTTYLTIRGYFNYDNVYKIMTYQVAEQRIILKELLSSEEYVLVSDIINAKRFNIVRFISKLDDILLKTNPEIKVYIGTKDSDFSYINKNIKTIYDEKITEGFKIIYKGIVYDYSI